MPCKEGRVVKFDPTFTVGTDVRIVDDISRDEVTFPNFLIKGRQLFGQFGGVGRIA